MAKKEKNKKPKLPSLAKYLWSKWFIIALSILAVGVIGAGAIGATYEHISELGLRLLGFLIVIIIFIGTWFLIAAILKANGKRGRAFYGEEPLA